jgi:hypothetical protein
MGVKPVPAASRTSWLRFSSFEGMKVPRGSLTATDCPERAKRFAVASVRVKAHSPVLRVLRYGVREPYRGYVFMSR